MDFCFLGFFENFKEKRKKREKKALKREKENDCLSNFFFWGLICVQIPTNYSKKMRFKAWCSYREMKFFFFEIYGEKSW